MVPLNISIFDFSPTKIFFRFLVPPKNFINEISSCSQFRVGTNFMDEKFQKSPKVQGIF